MAGVTAKKETQLYQAAASSPADIERFRQDREDMQRESKALHVQELRKWCLERALATTYTAQTKNPPEASALIGIAETFEMWITRGK